MNTVKFLLVSLLISSNTFSQELINTDNKSVSEASIVSNKLGNLDLLLNLTPGQKDQVSQIINGINQKNSQVSSMNLTQENKIQIIEDNEQAKIRMILNILNEAQKAVYSDSLSD